MHDDDIKQGHASALSLRAGLSSGRKPRWFDGHREVFVHPSSHNFGVTEFQHPFLVFHEKVLQRKCRFSSLKQTSVSNELIRSCLAD